MAPFESISIIVALSALFSFINHRWLKLPSTIGLMILALLTGLMLLALSSALPEVYSFFCNVVEDVDFQYALLDVMLSFLLFAGAMHVDLRALQKESVSVALFATIGVLLSTLVVGTLVYVLCGLIQLQLPFLHCLLFGALISPTDPIAVLAILKTGNVSESL